MNYAIGLIETRGLVASIEALDAALKAANVKLLNKELAEGGLVMITFVGDVGAVSAAVDAGALAASRIGEVVSAHVIPRLAHEVISIIEPKAQFPLEDENTQNKTLDLNVDKEICDENTNLNHDLVEENSQIKDTDDTVIFKSKDYSIFEKGGIDRLKVVQLRQLARQMNLKTIERSMIKFANKEELIKAIRKHHKGGVSK